MLYASLDAGGRAPMNPLAISVVWPQRGSKRSELLLLIGIKHTMRWPMYTLLPQFMTCTIIWIIFILLQLAT